MFFMSHSLSPQTAQGHLLIRRQCAHNREGSRIFFEGSPMFSISLLMKISKFQTFLFPGLIFRIQPMVPWAIMLVMTSSTSVQKLVFSLAGWRGSRPSGLQAQVAIPVLRDDPSVPAAVSCCDHRSCALRKVIPSNKTRRRSVLQLSYGAQISSICAPPSSSQALM